jgi:peroxiredoxin (alkyl hydroperoxide reductase subunit C)
MGHPCIKPVNVGQQVENFTMVTYLPTDYCFGEISLEQLKNEGKWTVLVFYPADFTFVCSTELSDFANLYDEFTAAGAEVITISTDTQFTHLAWKREEKSLEKARYIMGADPTGKISKMFGVYDHETGLALRGTFIISPEGVVVASEVNFYNVGRSAAETLRKLKASIYVAQHPEQACPANWREGDKTLTPSPDLVGKVFAALNK